ncbi:hypothetical protein TN66_004588 [Salmonella enterica subsp. enterica serovar Everleigh]|nr:hypothetical protein [Salmonella enterica subsp. enterica serovar Llandoff]EDN4145395.1 hypothetical protein [Salmonella enterica subsp. enterica]EGZ4608031.1 hypothetical protein [Salmonella enterica subsp. enterica serovar Everleigh]ELD7365287.1 hypothetical protein [Salmonella enterica]EDQ0850040.1 hypothetical protein [Salmonella enterica subsp. enterica serovar Llandoff]
MSTSLTPLFPSSSSFLTHPKNHLDDNDKIDDKGILTPPEDKELYAPTVQFFSYLPLAFHVQNGLFCSGLAAISNKESFGTSIL